MALAVFVIYLLYLTGPILIWVLFALIISMLFAPIIDFLERVRIPRALSVVIIYGGAFGLMGFLIYLMVPVFVYEARQFSQFFSVYFEKFSPPFRGLGIEAFQSVESFINALDNSLTKMASTLLGSVFSIFGGIFSTAFVIIVGIFLSLERQPIKRALALLSPKRYEKEILILWSRGQKKVSGWFLSRLLASLFITAASYLAFLVLKINYPLSLALFGGFLNFIPFLGPLIAGVVIFLLAAVNDFFVAVLAVLAFFLIQQIENNIITPILTKKFVGISPTLTLIALAIGGKLWGLLGAILAIPLFAVVAEVTREFLKMRKRTEEPGAPPLDIMPDSPSPSPEAKEPSPKETDPSLLY